MTTLISMSRMLMRILGVVQLILGLLFWTSNAAILVPVHMLLGLVLVIVLWIIAAVALMNGVLRGPAVGAVVWGFIVVGLGMTQQQILPGDFHWIIQVLHLIVGFAAVGISENLTAGILKKA